MNRREALLLLLGGLFAGPSARAAEPRPLVETPGLAAQVAAGGLPPVARRIPEEPEIAIEPLGRPGGQLRILMAGPKDTRLMVVYGYARLIRYTPLLTLEPDIAKAIDVESERVFTLHLRRGHKWSDGAPFTAEDFRFWYEDVALNPAISPSGLPRELMPGGEKPRVEFLDAATVRYSWSHPNPLFLPALAGPAPLFIFAPAHYLKRFHAKYADPAALAAKVKKSKQHNWAALFNRIDKSYRNDNPDLPSLEPWVLKTRPPADRFIFERNPFFHRIDATGRQLPYIDSVAMDIADSRIIPAKTGAGDGDLQARYLRFDNYTFLKEAEKRSNYTVRLWSTAPGSEIALYPNFNVDDPAWRALFRDVRFRHALSLAIDRHEINQAIYYGLAIEGQDTLLPKSPLYEPRFRAAWARYDPKEAGRLLDEIGLSKRDGEGTRLLADGRPAQIIVETSGVFPGAADVLELIRDTWREVGIKLFHKPMQLTVFRNRVFAGKAMMTADRGIENGLATAFTAPMEFAPTTQVQLQWPKWGQYYETKGRAGEAPDMPFAQRLMALLDDWFNSASVEARRHVWEQMLAITAKETPTIGLCAGVPQPVVVSNRLRNVPEDGIYNWDPGAQFGIYHPDSFWFVDGGRPGSPSSAAAL